MTIFWRSRLIINSKDNNLVFDTKCFIVIGWSANTKNKCQIDTKKIIVGL